MVVGVAKPDTEGIFCRFLEHSPMKLKLLGLLLTILAQDTAEIRMLLWHSYHTERTVEEYRGLPDRRAYKGLSISRRGGT